MAVDGNKVEPSGVRDEKTNLFVNDRQTEKIAGRGFLVSGMTIHKVAIEVCFENYLKTSQV